MKNKEKNDSNANSLDNIITINLTKITKKTTFILIKCVLDSEHSDNNVFPIQKFLNKIFCKIKKLSELKL